MVERNSKKDLGGIISHDDFHFDVYTFKNKEVHLR